MLLVAAILRIAACLHWSADLSADPDGYAALAAHLAAGEGYISPDGTSTAFRPPLYPLWLAALAFDGPIVLAVCQIILGVATVSLTCAVGGWFGLKRFALLAGLIVACDPLLLRYTPQVMTETFCAFLAILLIAALALQQQFLSLAHEKRSGHRPTWSLVAASFSLGIIMGLATLARPTFWAVIALLLADTCLRRSWPRIRKHAHPQSPPLPLPPSPSRAALALILLGLMVAVAPWAIRNAITLGKPVITTTHGGYTLLLANNPVFGNEVVTGRPGATWQEESLSDWQAMLEREMAEAGIAPSDELARDRWLRRRAIANIENKPVMFVQSSIYRLGRFWALAPLDPSDDTTRVASLFVSIFYGFFFVLAALGVIVFWRSERQGQSATNPIVVVWRSLLWLIVAFVIVHAVYWTDTRMRAPVVPAMALFAALGMRAIWRFGHAITRRMPYGSVR